MISYRRGFWEVGSVVINGNYSRERRNTNKIKYKPLRKENVCIFYEQEVLFFKSLSIFQGREKGREGEKEMGSGHQRP